MKPRKGISQIIPFYGLGREEEEAISQTIDMMLEKLMKDVAKSIGFEKSSTIQIYHTIEYRSYLVTVDKNTFFKHSEMNKIHGLGPRRFLEQVHTLICDYTIEDNIDLITK